METQLSLFQPFNPRVAYGMFGYPGHCCDAAISSDNPELAQECWEKGWMDGDTRTTMGTVLQKCELRAPKVAERLKSLGPCTTGPAPYMTKGAAA